MHVMAPVDDYRRALAAAVREYDSLAQQRLDVDKRLAAVAQTIGTLSRLCGLTIPMTWGLTDACRLVMRAGGVPMTAREVRDRLASIGFDLTRYTNELSAVHTILKRLNESGELRFVAQADGKLAYLWNRPPRAAGLGPDIAAFAREQKLESRLVRRRKAPR